MATAATYRPARPPYPSSSPTASSSSSPPPPSTPSKFPSEMERPWSGSAGGRETSDELRSPMSGGGSSAAAEHNATQQPAKSSNPLVDLIESEKRYVEELGAVIRKVAGAWSRANFPPPLLDSMFRSIEGVYKINRSFGSKLKEIGPNPSSPKALGDLLMRWIDDMEPAYTRYSTSYLSSFDHWPPVQSNPNLQGILQDVSAQLQPPPPASSPSGEWTLDALFLLPYNRLRYYKKLYARLLKSTQPGRNDHNLLVGANERLTVLLETVKERLDYTVGEESGEPPRERTSSNVGSGAPFGGAEGGEGARTSVASSGTDSRVSGASLFSANGGRMSNTSASTSFGNLSGSAPGGLPTAPLQPIHPQTLDDAPPRSPGMSQTLIDIERRLDAERTIDLFTMNPRKVRLQISPPNLPFTRKLRRSLDVEIFFTPNSTGEKVHHHRGYIFILSDLFLICERMEPHERAQKVLEADGAQGPDLWLCYPPLAGKHLQVAPGPTENHVEVVVMRKETFMLRVEGREMQTRLIKEFNDCIDFAGNLPPPNKPVTSPLTTSGPTFQSQGPTSPGFNALSPTSSARSSGVANGGPSLFPNGPSGMTSPVGHQQASGLTMPMERGGSLPALPPGRAADFRGERALSQASTYSNGSSNGAPSLPQQMDQMSLGPDGYSRSPMAGMPEGSPMSPPDYGNTVPSPRQQSHSDQLPPLPVSQTSGAPPRGASLGPRPSQSSSSHSNSSFNQFPPPRAGSMSPSNAGPHPNGQHPAHLGHPIAQPYPRRGPASMGGVPPSRYASGPLPPPPGGQAMGIPRSQSSASARSQPSLYPPEEEAPPLPPPHHYPNGPGGPQHPQGGWPPGGNGARGSPGPQDGGGHSPNGAYPPPQPPRNFHSASPVNRSPFDPSVNPNNFPHPPSGGHGGQTGAPSIRSRSAEPLTPVSLPSMGFSQRALSTVDGFALDDPSADLNSPPPSPKSNVDPATLSGPAIISAAMKCKVFLKKDHASWKSLGAARLKLYHQQSTNVKQVVVESDSSSKTMLISTIVLTDGVERVGKTGVAIEISDQGTRTGIVYMIQLRNEVSAGGLYDSLLAGTTRGK